MGVDADAARAALSDMSERDRQVRTAAVSASMPWWYVSGLAALLVIVGITSDYDTNAMGGVFCAISIFSFLAEKRFKIRLPESVTFHWAILLTWGIVIVVVASAYFGVEYAATRAGFSRPGAAGGVAMAVAFVAHMPLFGWATRKAVGMTS